jgi:ABC-type transport system involved in cytochrome bd biosynthesis fused ATPase/permease subunit
MNKFTLEIDYNIMDEITRQNLQDAYRHAEDDEMRNALDLVINYFSSEDQYNKWVQEKQKYV